MDFPAEAETNFRIFDDFSTLYWRLYCLDPQDSANWMQNGVCSPELIKEIELNIIAIRNRGCLIEVLPNYSGVLVFSLEPSIPSLASFAAVEDGAYENAISIGSANFYNVCNGDLSTAELAQKLLSSAQAPIIGLETQQERARNNKKLATILSELTYSVLHTVWITSIAASVSLHMVNHLEAIPLGKRSLLIPSKKKFFGLEKGRFLLFTPDISLSQGGKIIMSCRTESQPGLTQFSIDSDSPRLLEDIWLAPIGIISRFRGVCHEDSLLEPEESSHPQTTKPDPTKAIQFWSLKSWKFAVCNWLGKLGVSIGNPDDMFWIQVEIVHTFPKQGGGYTRVLRTISWPAEFSFRRVYSDEVSSLHGAESLSRDMISPLQFAHQWLKDSASRNKITSEQKVPTVELETDSPAQTGPFVSPKNPDTPAMTVIESLAKTLAFPDIQTNTVYPTPPGGSLSQTPGQHGSDGLGITNEFTPNYPHVPRELAASGGQTSHSRGDSGLMLSAADVTSPGFGAGQGMYDATADDDMFEDMDDNFGDKGITEADFNFFDEPGLSKVDMDIDLGNPSPDFLLEENQPGSTESPNKTSWPIDSLHTTDSGLQPDSEPVSYDNTLEHNTNRSPQEKLGPGQKSEAEHDNETRSMTPPLSPLKIKSLLFSDSAENRSSGTTQSLSRNGDYSLRTRSRSHYQPIPFQQNLNSSDEKYGVNGKYWFLQRSAPEPPVGSVQAGIHIFSSIDGLKPEREVAALTQYGDQESTSSSSSCSIVDGDPGHYYIAATAPVGRKRKWDEFNDKSSPPPYLENQLRISDREEDALFSGLLRSSANWSFIGLFAEVKETLVPALCRREDIIPIAQLLVDQLTQSSLQHNIAPLRVQDEEAILLDAFIDDLGSLTAPRKVDLMHYVTLEEKPLPQNETVTPKKSPDVCPSIAKLDPPYVRLRRGNSLLEILPTAIPFWETFGLEPLRRGKNIIPYCLHPGSMKEAADAFLERLGSTYTSSGLGKCSRPSNSKGLVPWSLDPEDLNYTKIMQRLQHVCETLGALLSNITSSNQNIVVFIVNPLRTATANVDICVAFLRLFQKYIGEPNKSSPQQLNEVVLQIVPSDFIASSNSLVLPAQMEYLNLALEVYSRCPPHDPTSDMFGCAPPFSLVEPIVRTIPFRVRSEEESPLEEGQAYHVAYSVSLDQHWATAAWTDNIGRHQLTMSYCLRESGSNARRSLSEVRKEIWETTAIMIGPSKHIWSVTIVRDEPIEQEELEDWVQLGKNDNHLKLTLLAINTRPGLYIKLPPSPLQLNLFAQPATGSTPVSTPKPNTIPSPDPSTNAPTPPFLSNISTLSPTLSTEQTPTPTQSQSQYQQSPPDPNAETILIDKSDESWSVILSHALNNSHSLTKFRPALASGYLIRRRGISDVDGQASAGVNLIYSQLDIPHDVLLKDVLRMYRDLSTLSRTRGIVHAQGNRVLPWHVATAVTGQQILSHIL
ncbi:mediator of RNA polymerase II transcription subunit 13 [Myotisia sp. PD_48]|nr:mediator of RNA polymerase II transcription subunit 13 [Myotisia sp. PD_48]